eukprot:TRINITY_DN120972_c0_g1_i1.p1 TRINITY_DN120972_c0_g1~~TRINITY_DN120972_c0_g1_i1.p1  ORF type:complete len:912 (-),score=183.20 TRINITY_DN120972_c0_g1_i1:119-2854(-)
MGNCTCLCDKENGSSNGLVPATVAAELAFTEKNHPKSRGQPESGASSGSARPPSSSSSKLDDRHKSNDVSLDLDLPGVQRVKFGDHVAAERQAFLRSFLIDRDTPVGSWSQKSQNGKRNLADLQTELDIRRRCTLIDYGPGHKVQRIVHLVKVRLLATIMGVEHVLCSRLQFLHDGTTTERRQLPLRRLAWKSTCDPITQYDEALVSEESSHIEDRLAGARRALREWLGLEYHWQAEHLNQGSFNFSLEEKESSASYDGLATVYAIHEYTCRVVDADHRDVQLIGLPSGQEFATLDNEGDEDMGRTPSANVDLDACLDTPDAKLNVWAWECSDGTSVAASKAGHKALMIKRVQLPKLSGVTLSGFRSRALRASVASRPPSAALRVVQEGRTTDWDEVHRMAENIKQPDYTLKAFLEALSVFPELDYYLLDGNVVPAVLRGVAGNASSGRTIGDEYQRTVGAFFAVYWLMRLDIDGREGFSFGVDADYAVIGPPHCEEEKRQKFYRDSPWEQFTNLLVDAELLQRDGSTGSLAINDKRLVTLLALTAIHDIMKMQSLLPTVQRAHAPYHGYKAGDKINDHDQALSYLMDHYPELLPSFNGLSAEEKRSVKFTQSELCYNQGWLVQAEAPPGAIFSTMRRLMLEPGSKVQARDIALYFVHWLTDLAGAEPTPLGGCEKFVVKFPLAVLQSFLRSFRYVQLIAKASETEVMEEYLCMRWREHTPDLGEVPTGSDAIAKMRLLCMAQANSGKVLDGMESLPAEDRDLLAIEMSRTGCAGQRYSAQFTPQEVQQKQLGPAFLIYYGPAFLQSLGADDPVDRLRVLAEVYRGARTLWPATKDQVSKCVTVRIDAIKALRLQDIRGALESQDAWIIHRENDSEAFIERCSCEDLPSRRSSLTSQGESGTYVMNIPGCQ